jgi:RNA polymerase sigma factor (sigma-70 family)
MTRTEEMVELIHAAQGGNKAAYEEIVHRFQDMAYGYAYAYLNDFHLAQDAAQEAFIEAYACLPALREAYAFPAWLKRIVFKHCDRLTRRKHFMLASLEAAAEVASSLPGPEMIAEQREFENQVQSVIQDLPVSERVVTTLFYINGYSQQEIANFLDMPPKTVKSRLHASRQRLKERMLDMVQNELKANALPGSFTQETLAQAILRAGELNKVRQFEQAEGLLRQVLAQSPGHPEALKELNRTLMRGGVYGQGRWDLLPELVRQGELILEATDDETVYRELARTLLAVPAMQDAIAFLKKWNEKKGPSLERLGMLAWAEGCAAQYDSAENTWRELIGFAQQSDHETVLRFLPFACYTLVDCFSATEELPRAQRIAIQAWEVCSPLGPIPETGELQGDSGWLMIFHQAQLDYRDVAQVLMKRYDNPSNLEANTTHLCLRAWVDEPQMVVERWLEWAQERINFGEWERLEQLRLRILGTLRKRGSWAEANQLAQAIWERVGETPTLEAAKARIPWDWERFNPLGFIQSQDWEAAEVISQRELKERGSQAGGPWAILIAAGQGIPTPPELVQAVEKDGIQSVDEYGLFGWYLVAREAAASGEEAKAFEALCKALSYWSNSPYGYDAFWEKDSRWGNLREHPKFKRAFAEKQERIGPIYGQLHYFPSW